MTAANILQSAPEYTGKDVSYYLVSIATPKRLGPYTAECEDIIEALGMTFAEGCAFKAIWRKCAARTLGIAKAGYKGGLYDAEKAQYYGARMVAAESAKQCCGVDKLPASFGQQNMIDPAEVEIGEEAGGKWYSKSELIEAINAASVEPASLIDDESPRSQVVQQNGEMAAEVYAAVDAVDPWKGAPEWAKYKAQDEDGEWWWYGSEPIQDDEGWYCEGSCRRTYSADDGPSIYWRTTLISR